MEAKPKTGEKALIGFLGTTTYSPVHYVLNGEPTPEVRLSLRALARFFPDHEVVVFATREALERNWATVREEFGYEPEAVLVPAGRGEKEIWKLLKLLTERFSSYGKLVLDITHGFRAQPLLAFSAGYLLHTLGRAKIEGIYYASYQGHGRPAEIVDLAPLMDMLRWADGLSGLKRHGSTAVVSELLSSLTRRYWTTEGAAWKPRTLGPLADLLDRLSIGLALNRAREASELALRLRRTLPPATRELRRVPQLAPVAPYFQDALRGLAGLVPRGKRRPYDPPSRTDLRALAGMIRYYLEVRAYVQAITLGREAIVTRLCLEKGLDPFGKEARRAMESQINAWHHLKKSGSPLRSREQWYVDLWERVVDVRNDVNHAGFRAQPVEGPGLAKKIGEAAREIADWLEQ